MTGVATGLVIATILTASLGSSNSTQRRVVLVIGADVGAEDEPRLRWAESDALRFGRLMVELGGVDARDVFRSLGGSVREAQIQMDAVAVRLRDYRQRRLATELFVYVAGHADPKAVHLRGEYLDMADLRRWFEAAPVVTRVMLVDTCYSGAVWRPRSLEDAMRTVTRRPSPRGTVYVTASAANEVAQESDELGGAYFSAHLMSGLRGAADANGDQRVTVSEMYQHTYHRTLQDSFSSASKVQHPQFKRELVGEADLVLTQIGPAAARLGVAKDFRGHLLVVAEQTERVVLDTIHLKGSNGRYYALAPGRYRVLVKRAEGIAAGLMEIESGQTVGLPALRLVSQSEITRARGPRHYDPTLLTYSLAAAPVWRWTGHPELSEGLLGFSVEFELTYRRHAFAFVAVDYVRSLRANHWLVSLDLLRLVFGGGFTATFGALHLDLGGSFGAGVGRQVVVDDAGGESEPALSELFTIGPTVRARWHFDEAWSVGLGAEIGAQFLRIARQTEAEPFVQLTLGAEFRL